MSISTSIGAYQDCLDLYTRALEVGGIRIQVPSIDAATHLRMRMHQARALDRKKNLQIYSEVDHPMHGRSVFDGLTCRIKRSASAIWLYVELGGVDLDTAVIESLPDVTEETKAITNTVTKTLTFDPEQQTYLIDDNFKRRV